MRESTAQLCVVIPVHDDPSSFLKPYCRHLLKRTAVKTRNIIVFSYPSTLRRSDKRYKYGKILIHPRDLIHYDLMESVT